MRTRGCGPGIGPSISALVSGRSARSSRASAATGLRAGARPGARSGGSVFCGDGGGRLNLRGDRAEMIGALQPGEHFDRLVRLLAHAPRRVLQQRLHLRDRRRLLAARDRDRRTGCARARRGRRTRPESSRVDGGRERAAQRPRVVPPHGRVRLVREHRRQPAAELHSVGGIAPREQRRRGPRAHDRIGVPAGEGEQLLRQRGPAPGTFPACARQAASTPAIRTGPAGSASALATVSVSMWFLAAKRP